MYHRSAVRPDSSLSLPWLISARSMGLGPSWLLSLPPRHFQQVSQDLLTHPCFRTSISLTTAHESVLWTYSIFPSCLMFLHSTPHQLSYGLFNLLFPCVSPPPQPRMWVPKHRDFCPPCSYSGPESMVSTVTDTQQILMKLMNESSRVFRTPWWLFRGYQPLISSKGWCRTGCWIEFLLNC